jgi:hypothetical protein
MLSIQEVEDQIPLNVAICLSYDLALPIIFFTTCLVFMSYPQGLHLVDQYLVTFIYKGVFLIVKNRFNIL